MQLAPGSFSSRRDTLAFFICLLLSLAARLAPPGVQQGAAAGITRSVLAPFLYLQEQAELVSASRSRYARVMNLRDSVFVRALQTTELEQENVTLRGLLGLSARLSVAYVSAQVIQQALPTSSMMALVSAGRREGVREQAPVVVPAGLVGVVQTVEERVSRVQIWTHPDFRVSAMTADGAVFGIVGPRGSDGPNTMLLELQGVPFQQAVSPGTMVYTSGLGGPSGVYPRGIPIGTVLGIGEEQAGWSRTYVLQPAVHPASLSHVVILIGQTPDLAAAFPRVVP